MTDVTILLLFMIYIFKDFYFIAVFALFVNSLL